MASVRRASAVAIVAGAVILAGCGGSSKPKAATGDASNAPTTQAPAVESTSTTEGAGQPAVTQPGATSGAATASTTRATGKAGTTATTKKPVTTKVVTAAPLAQVLDTTSTTKVGAEKPQPGGTFTENILIDGASLDPPKLANPITSGTQDGMRIFPIFDALLYQETNGALHPQLAQSMTSTD